MTRAELIRHPFSPSMRLIEVGASYSPIVPKAEGWNTTIIDHATQAALREKYHGESAERIEEVDYVWSGQPVDSLLPAEDLGQFDGLIASHVGEHIPDLIGFLQSIDRLLKPTGVIALALPDMRSCFDFFQPRTTTGDLLDAHRQGSVRHRPGKAFDVEAYRAGNDGPWLFGIASGQIHLEGTLAKGLVEYERAQRSSGYTDTHASQFTPSSFRLIILELFHLGLIPWRVSRLDPAAGVEFYVWLERSHIRLPDARLEGERARLLELTLRETAAEHLCQLGELPKRLTLPPEPVVEPQPKEAEVPTITAIVPLYNGARYIEGCLDSVLGQTLPPVEVIVVNDGSSDAGHEIVSAYINRHPEQRIVMLHQANAGQSAARNLGAKHAQGDLLAFLDQDDRWYPAHLHELAKPFVDPPPGQPVGWVYSDLDEADGDGHIIHHTFLMKMADPQHPKTNLYRCIDRDMFVLPSASLISRAVFEEVGGFDERLSGYEDDDLFLRIFRSAKQNVFLPVALSKWCIHHDSASYTPRMRYSRMVYCRKLLETFPDQPERNIYYSRDTILPRFYIHARSEYRRALVSDTLSLVEETMAEMRFLLDVAVAGDGINTIMSHRGAKKMQRLFAKLTPEQALRRHRLRQRVQPISRRLPHRVLLKAVSMMPLYG